MIESTFGIAAWVFARVLSVVYFAAFLSLLVQVKGLYGQNGIQPISQYVELINANMGASKLTTFPSLFWLSTSDFFLVGLAVAGCIASVLAFAGFAQTIMFILLWLFYLSFVSMGQEFLSFQWDILILEVGFLALFLGPLDFGFRPFAVYAPPVLVIILFWWLAFRLNFSSGVVKLSSGDETWRNLTALNFHFKTQPIPNAVAWYAHQLPYWFREFSTLVMFIIELVMPFLFFVPGKARLFGALSIIFLQILIILTGNYAFFNLLTIAICFFLIADAWWIKFFPILDNIKIISFDNPSWFHYGILVPITVVIAILGTAWVVEAVSPRSGIPNLIRPISQFVIPFRIVNPYGLFAIMTTNRNEIIIEGSNDEKNWEAYEFKYKPGDLKRMPPFVAPHQPRVDWQMWFAALGNFNQNPWFQNLMLRILQGEPTVLSLLEKNPFADKPPRLLRATVYQYHFTNFQNKEGKWWNRTFMGPYSPVLGLKEN